LWGVLLSEIRLRRRYEADSASINQELEKHPPSAELAEEAITIFAENKKDNLRIMLDDLVYIRAAENYVDVHYLLHSKLQKSVLRNTITAIASQLESNSSRFYRCHKSYLVNLTHVQKVSGNAQGYKLHLQYTEDAIPVSRGQNTSLHSRLAAHP